MFDLKKICDDSFFSQSWMKDFKVWKGIADIDAFGFKQFNNLLNHSELSTEDLVLVENNNFFVNQKIVEKVAPLKYQKLNKYNIIDSYKLNEVLRKNIYSIRIFAITRFDSNLHRFAQSVESMTNRHCDTVTIYSPKDSKCYLWHEDDFEGFAVQLEGKKTWKICRPGTTEEDNDFRIITLKKGDVMYFPKGIRHCAFTEDENSLHMTFGLRELKFNDIMKAMATNFNLTLFESNLRYSSDSFNIDMLESKKEMSKGIFELNQMIQNKDFFRKISTLVLKGIEKGSEFISLPYDNSKEKYKFSNVEEIQAFPVNEEKTTIVFRGVSLVFNTNLIKAKEIIEHDIFSKEEFIKTFSVKDIDRLLCLGLIVEVNN